MNATTEVGIMKLQSVDMILPTDSLDHDIPVDREHVENLKKSLQGQGQLAPILVWVEGNQIIDGFHRLTALKELGIPEVRATVVDCTETEFIDARVVSATMHKGVSFARMVLWIRDAWSKTKWADRLGAAQAFRRTNSIPLDKRMVGKLNKSEIMELDEWADAKAAMWGLRRNTIADMLQQMQQASPQLIAQVRSAPPGGLGRIGARRTILTRGMLAGVAKNVPDHILQEAVIKKALAEKLTMLEVIDLAQQVTQTPTVDIPLILNTNWVGVAGQGLQRSKENEKTHREIREIAIRMLENAKERIDILTRTKPVDDDGRIGDVLVGLQAAIGQYLGIEDAHAILLLRSRVSNLKSINKTLREENERLQRDLAAANRTLGMGRRIANDN